MNANQIKYWFLRRGETGVPGENLSVQRSTVKWSIANEQWFVLYTSKRQFHERKVKSLKCTNDSRWWKEVKNISGVSAKDDMWTLGTLCEKINDFFVGLTSRH